MVRRNNTLDEIAQAGLPSEVPTNTERETLDPVTDWPDLHASLATLLHQAYVIVQVHVAAIAELPVMGVGEFNPRQQPGLPVVDAGLGSAHRLLIT